jgi:hypothetical protein
MATALFSFIFDGKSAPRLGHMTFGDDDVAADAALEAHAEICPKFGPAFRGKKTVQIYVEISELPPADEEALQEWFDDEFNLGEDDEEEDDAGEEEEDEEDE